jgi:hypothetical protein
LAQIRRGPCLPRARPIDGSGVGSHVIWAHITTADELFNPLVTGDMCRLATGGRGPVIDVAVDRTAFN